MKRRQVKIGLGLATGAIIAGVLVIIMAAWIKGGIKPAQPVEVPVQIAAGQGAGT